MLGVSEGGPMCALFAATLSRTGRTALVTMGSYARRNWAPDYPIGRQPEQDGWLRPTAEQWGAYAARRFLAERAPSIAGDEEAIHWYASYLVRGASPAAVAAITDMNEEIDVRPRAADDPRSRARPLPRARVPARGQPLHGRAAAGRAGRRAARRRPPAVGGRPGGFAPRNRGLRGRHPRRADPDRVLATVLVVRAADAEAACDLVRADVARFRGRELELTGDLLIATFDGPARAIRCALSLADAARAMGTLARAGIHTGECDVVDGVLTGPPIQIARTMVDAVRPGDAVVSSTVRDRGRVGDKFAERMPPGDVSPDGSRLFTVVPPAVPAAARRRPDCRPEGREATGREREPPTIEPTK